MTDPFDTSFNVATSGTGASPPAATAPAATPTPAPNPGGNYAAMGLTGAGTLFGAYSQIQAGKYNARAAEFSANYQRMLASQSIQEGESLSSNRMLQQRQAIGRTNAGAAGSGVVAGAGSAGAARGTQQALGAEDIQNIRVNAARGAFGYDVGAAEQMRRAQMARMTEQSSVAGTLIGGASQEALESDPNYRGYRSSGVPL